MKIARDVSMIATKTAKTEKNEQNLKPPNRTIIRKPPHKSERTRLEIPHSKLTQTDKPPELNTPFIIRASFFFLCQTPRSLMNICSWLAVISRQLYLLKTQSLKLPMHLLTTQLFALHHFINLN